MGAQTQDKGVVSLLTCYRQGLTADAANTKRLKTIQRDRVRAYEELRTELAKVNSRLLLRNAAIETKNECQKLIDQIDSEGDNLD